MSRARALLFLFFATSLPVNGASIPFIGCASDGQTGPLKPPAGKYQDLSISADAAQHLAYYKAAQGPGVLAPRGWSCFGTYGSSGQALYVSPQPVSAKQLFSGSKPFAGPAIELAQTSGETSGRFAVAAAIARYFPAHNAFVKDVISEGIQPASAFPTGTYPKDKLTYKSKEIVEYQTPPQTDGLGTNSNLQKSASPISGVAMLVGKAPDLWHLSIRLPDNLGNLTPAIIQQVEREAASAR